MKVSFDHSSASPNLSRSIRRVALAFGLGVAVLVAGCTPSTISQPRQSRPQQAPATPQLTGAQHFQRAKEQYKAGDFAAARESIDRALERAPGNSEMLAFRKEVDRRLATFKAERAKADRARAIESMPFYEGKPLGLAVAQVRVTRTFQTDFTTYTAAKDAQFVWLVVGVKNFGNRTVHANPNYFTLSTPDGYTVTVDSETTYSTKYLDAIDLPPGGHSSGWLIFHAPKASEYILNMHAFSNQARKRVVATNWKLK